ncbi:MAG: NAD(P)H-dependent oxidoreductase [Bryobacteraceae bacterium]
MKLLRIDSSPFGESAISRCLAEEFVERWRTEHHDGAVTKRDLTISAIPAVDAAWVWANYTPRASRTRHQEEVLKLSSELIGELLDADEYVIGLPMHNFGPPSVFKLWVDQVITPSTLSARPLAGKRGTFIIAAGRIYIPGSLDANKNYLVPWLRTVFGSLGMSDMQFVIADGTKKVHSGEVAPATFLVSPREAIRALFAHERNLSEAPIK